MYGSQVANHPDVVAAYKIRAEDRLCLELPWSDWNPTRPIPERAPTKSPPSWEADHYCLDFAFQMCHLSPVTCHLPKVDTHRAAWRR